MQTLLERIAAFCAEHKISESQFGVMALNDKNLIPQLRGDDGKRPRRLWPETENRVVKVMDEYVPQPRDQQAAA